MEVLIELETKRLTVYRDGEVDSSVQFNSDVELMMAWEAASPAPITGEYGKVIYDYDIADTLPVLPSNRR